MSKTEVMGIMPEPPLYVERGDSETSVWVYDERLITVKSESKGVGFQRTSIPKKTNQERKHTNVRLHIRLLFDINDKLMAWGPTITLPNPDAPKYDCAGVCNGTAYLDECGVCIESLNDDDKSDAKSDGSFKLELKVEGTQEPDGSLIIKGGE